MDSLRRKETALLSLIALVIVVTAIPDYSGLPPGPYCGKRATGCCNGRIDSCAAPIVGTLCYCDDFCNRTRSEDCCPDYWSFCKGIEPPPELFRTCRFQGRELLFGKKTRYNCNDCACEEVNGKLEVLCEQEECMIDPDLISTVNVDSDRLRWEAHNYTEFWGRTLKDGILLRLGTLQPDRSVMNMNPVRKIYDPHSLPRNFDSSNKWGSFVGGVRDQGWCGSSWAISTADVAADRYAIMSKGLETPRLSPQHLLACNNRGQQSCNGGYLDRAWLFFRKFGIVEDKCYPYKAAETKCPYSKKGNLMTARCEARNPLRRDYYRTGPAYRLGNETDIMFEIMTSGPVQATMKIYQDFFSYRGGIYRHSPASASHRTGYHSVRIVGWGEDNTVFPPQKYWKIANSWGEHWGERGYFRIIKGVNECDIETFVLAVWAHTIDDVSNDV